MLVEHIHMTSMEIAPGMPSRSYTTSSNTFPTRALHQQSPLYQTQSHTSQNSTSSQAPRMNGIPRAGASTPQPALNTMAASNSNGGNITASNNIINQVADASKSLYQICLSLKRRLQQVPGFEVHMREMEEENRRADGMIDPVTSIWNCFRKGFPLMTIYNALVPHKPLHLDTSNMPEAKKAKAAAFKFVQACLIDLNMAEQCFQIRDLYGDDTTGFVKVTAVVNKVLDILQEKNLLLPPMVEDESDADTITGETGRAKTHRDHVINELVTTERKYVQDLETLQEFKKLVHERGVIAGDTIHDIFLNLDALLDFQRWFLIRIETMNTLPSDQQHWGKLFVDMQNDFQVYQPYVANQTKCNDTAQREFDKLSTLGSNVTQDRATLQTFLMKPFVRLTKYPMLLKDLRDKSDASELEKEELNAGWHVATSVLDRTNETIDKVLRMNAVEELRSQVDDWKGHNVDHFGELLLFGTFTVVKSDGKNDVEREVSIILSDLGPRDRIRAISLMKRRPLPDPLDQDCAEDKYAEITGQLKRSNSKVSMASFLKESEPSPTENRSTDFFNNGLNRKTTHLASPPSNGRPRGGLIRRLGLSGSSNSTPSKSSPLKNIYSPSPSISRSGKLVKEFASPSHSSPLAKRKKRKGLLQMFNFRLDLKFRSVQFRTILSSFRATFQVLRRSNKLTKSPLDFHLSWNGPLSTGTTFLEAIDRNTRDLNETFLGKEGRKSLRSKTAFERKYTDEMAIKSPRCYQYKIYLFERILLCCKDINPNKPKKLMGNNKPTADKKGKPRLQLKGRIFMQNVTDTVQLAKPGSYTIQIFWKGDPGVENFVIRFQNEEVMKKWFKLVDHQRLANVGNGKIAGGSFKPGKTSDTEFAWVNQGGQPMHNPYKEDNDDDDTETGTLIGTNNSEFAMSRNASSTSLRSRSATGESGPPQGFGRSTTPRYPMGFTQPPLSVHTQVAPGTTSPNLENGGNSYFSPGADSPISTRTSNSSGMYPFPRQPTPNNGWPEDHNRFTAPAIGRTPSRDGQSPMNGFAIGGRSVQRPSLPAMAQQNSQQIALAQNRLRSASSPDIHNNPNGRRPLPNGQMGQPAVPDVPVPPFPAHMAHMRGPVNRSQNNSPINHSQLPMRSATQSPSIQRERLNQQQDYQNMLQRSQTTTPSSITTQESRTISPPVAATSTPAIHDSPIIHSLKVKVSFDNNYVTLVAPLSIGYQSLVDRIDAKLSRFTNLSIGRGTIKLRYRDEDGDYVAIHSDEDIHIAFSDWQVQQRHHIQHGQLGEIQLYCHGCQPSET